MPKTIATTPSWYWPEGVPRVIGIPPFRVPDYALRRALRRQDGRPALVSGQTAVSASKLAAQVRLVARWVDSSVPTGGRLAVSAGPSAHGVALVLGALSSAKEVILLAPGDSGTPAPLEHVSLAVADQAGIAALKETGLDVTDSYAILSEDAPWSEEATSGAMNSSTEHGTDSAVACMSGRFGPACHTHRSLLAGAVALGTFLGSGARGPWLSTASPCTWEGFLAVAVALISGSQLILSAPGDDAAGVAEEQQVAWSLSTLDEARSSWASGRRRRRSGGGHQAVVVVDGPFDPDERRALSSNTGGPVLTLFGMAETGPILASHPSWYLDESVGIPVTNMHVVPAEPDSGEPIGALWELVDHALVTVRSPSLATNALKGEQRFSTGVMAASDPNGMLYLVDEW